MGVNAMREAGRRSDLDRTNVAEPLEFTRIASGGFGDPYNGIAHSMSLFNDQVFVGTSRANLQMILTNQNAPNTSVPPVRCPENIYELDRRAQIWRYDLRSGRW